MHKYFLAFVGLGLGCLTIPVHAAANLTVNCPGQTISGAIASSADTVINITVNGSCSDNIEVPGGYVVTLNAGTTPSIAHASALSPAVRVFGRLTIDNIPVSSNLTADNAMVVAGKHSFVRIVGSTLTATNALAAVAAWEASALELIDTSVSGGAEEAMLVMEGAHIYFGVHTGGKSVSISNSGRRAISCYQGNLMMNTVSNTSITIGPSSVGLSTLGCAATIGRIVDTQSRGTITFSQNSTHAIQAQGGDAIALAGVNITSNSNIGLEVSAGTVDLDKALIANNARGIVARRNGVVTFNTLFGASTVRNNTAANFSCYQNGQVYANAGAVKNASGTNLTSTQCLTVGGTTRN